MPRPRHALACAAAVALGLHAAMAQAQWGAGVAIESDHRFRGVSLSDERPAPRLNLAWEGGEGWYAGGSLMAVTFDAGRRQAAVLAYAGRALRWSPQMAAELGLTATHFAADRGRDYAELLAGLIAPRWSARLYLSPDYFGSGRRSAYAELNAGWPLAGEEATLVPTLFGHLGALRVFERRDEPGERWRHDARVGLNLGLARSGLELQLSFVTGSRGAAYSGAGTMRRSTWVAGASWAF